MTAIVVIEAIVILLLLILMAGLLKSHAEILRQLDRLGVGEDVPDGNMSPAWKGTGMEKAPTTQLSGVDPQGSARVVTLGHGRGSTLIAFLSSSCASCQVFWEKLNGDYELPTPDTRVVIVTKGAGSESPSRISELAPKGLPLVMSDDTWDLFRVPLTPYFLLVDGDARVLGEGSATTWDHLLGLFRRSVADAEHPTRLDTEDRRRFSDERLTGSGIEPGDPALYDNPLH
jgi:hypothetical protein